MNKNKSRGKYFENKIVKYFQNEFNLTKHECHRAQASGTFQMEYGDIVFTDVKTYPILVECKYRQNISLDWFFPSLNSEVTKWIEQIKNSEKKFKKDFPNLSDEMYCSILISARPNLSDPYVLCLRNPTKFLTFKNYISLDEYHISTLSQIKWNLPLPIKE